MGESYYEMLGVDADASVETIEQAYRERLKETHPDVSDDEDASERTKKLIEAKDVLTDDEERARYDQLGHDAYVQLEDTIADVSGATTQQEDTATDSSAATDSENSGADASGWQTGNRGGTTGTQKQRSRNRRRGRGRHVRDDRETVSGKSAEDSWYSGNDEPGWENTEDNWRAWNTDGSFSVERGGDAYRFGRMFSSQRSLILLISTFIVYPVLLFGALLPEFPLAVNLTVGMCVVLVIAYLQSIPEVGIAVFGLWTLLLPMVFIWLGVALLSIQSLIAMISVVFPFFLSVLTRIAIRPLSAG